MNWSIGLSVLGMVVSVVVGWATYKFADRRSKNQRYLTSKATVLQELSKSLGEDSVPTPNIIRSTMNSVLRENGDPDLEIEVDEVLDDLMRQVTADPFLDSDRRRKLQGDIEIVREESLQLQTQIQRREREPYDGRLTSTYPATLLGMLAAFLSAIGIALVLVEDPSSNHRPSFRLADFLESFNSEMIGYLLPAVGMAAALFFVVVRVLSDEDFLRVVKRFFRDDRDEPKGD